MKKKRMLTGLVALTGIVLVMTGCCGSGGCPFKKGKASTERSTCEAVKGSPECVVACKK